MTDAYTAAFVAGADFYDLLKLAEEQRGRLHQPEAEGHMHAMGQPDKGVPLVAEQGEDFSLWERSGEMHKGERA